MLRLGNVCFGEECFIYASQFLQPTINIASLLPTAITLFILKFSYVTAQLLIIQSPKHCVLIFEICKQTLKKQLSSTVLKTRDP